MTRPTTRQGARSGDSVTARPPLRSTGRSDGPSSGLLAGLHDGLLDLAVGTCCLGCEQPGRLLCGACDDLLPTRDDPARAAWPTPTPAGLAPPWAAASYADLPRAMVLGLKEDGMLALTRPLARMLAVAVDAAAPPTGPLVLVPVPSRPASVRVRGHDPTYAMTARVARLLRAEGRDVVASRLLRTRPGVVDQAGLGATERAANLDGSMTCPTRGLRRLARRRPHAHVVVCDDVLTTGSTAREAQRALEAVGLTVVGIAAVAATPLRSAGRAVVPEDLSWTPSRH